MGGCHSAKEGQLKRTSSRKSLTPTLKEIKAKQQRLDLNSYFDRFDRDHDGLLDRTDIANMMSEIQSSKKAQDSIEEMVEHFLGQVDTDRSGRISKEEFRKFY
jgi:Ca2+-binding EF-hand superfamily protein